MKIIATTPNGEPLIELTSNEFHELKMAQKALDGQTFIFDQGQSVDLRDVAPLFKAMRIWMMSKLAINSLAAAVEHCNLALGIKNGSAEINNQISPEEKKNSY